MWALCRQRQQSATLPHPAAQGQAETLPTPTPEPSWGQVGLAPHPPLQGPRESSAKGEDPRWARDHRWPQAVRGLHTELTPGNPFFPGIRNILPTQNTPSQAKNQRTQNARERPKLKSRGRRQEVARPGAAWPGNARLVNGCGEGWGGGHSGEERHVCFFILARKFLKDRRETISEQAQQLHVATSERNSVYHSRGGAALPRGHTGGSCPHPVPAQPHPAERRWSQARSSGATLLRCRGTEAAPWPPPTAQATHHLDGRMAEVGLRHRGVVTLHHVNPFPGQGLDDRLVSLQGGHLVPFEDEAAHAAVQLAGQQELDDRRLDVLLLVLVDVKGVPEVLGDVICSDRRPPRVAITPKCSRTGYSQSLPASWSCWWDGGWRMSSWRHRYEAVCRARSAETLPLIHQECREPGQTWVCHTTAIQAQDARVAAGKATEERFWTSLWLTQSHSSTRKGQSSRSRASRTRTRRPGLDRVRLSQPVRASPRGQITDAVKADLPGSGED